MARTVLVRDVMSKDVKTISMDSNVKDVVASMNKFNIGSIIVCKNDKPVGVISERDILRKVVEPCLPPESTTAMQVMTSPVVTIGETASINEAAKLMTDKRVRKIPVMKKDKLVGIITFTDIVTETLSMFSMLGELMKPQS